MTGDLAIGSVGTNLRRGVGQGLVVAVASLLGLAMFCWPLVASVLPRSGGQSAPWLMLVLVPVLLVIVLLQVGSGELDPRTLAMLGVLSAVNAALRLVSAGTGGIELVFFLLVLAGYVFGATFGFLLGMLSLFASALLTAGVGPWLPFQMLAAGWIGLGAGMLGRVLAGRVDPRGRAEIAALAIYSVVVAYLFGALMNLWFWPFAIGGDTAVSYVPGGPLVENLRRFVVFTLTTSTLTWDTVRAVTNVVAVLVLGRPVLGTLRRAQRRAAWADPAALSLSRG
ncbi:energy-coupling factor transport system substrate-specific component [Sanguibacter gelidistatuariae]|uniref:Energy-coupling factor transport system substrate-specific component n=1 Tax=Sanguibacter gelidistatuariae TaxID=1814289 RepID=A0A1G6REY4_9MICO|nr:ECF transporter S component [Sanguibacter gelidistatuariae]SDD03220.1 energy-coupling factor transport system substrate-specific component [Sanguibacter gelidistatuariae]